MPDQTDRLDLSTDAQALPGIRRRAVLRAAGVVGVGAAGAGALAACGGSSTPSTGSGGAAAPSSSTSSGSSSAASSTGTATGSSSGGAAQGTPVKTASVPVGGGVINTDQLFVVTQPTAGEFKAFSAICTHQGCPVSKVEGGLIKCPCHGSQYDITTGTPNAAGPAKKPLAAKTATVSGDSVYIA